MVEKDLRLFAVFRARVHRRAVHGVATRLMPAVCPIQGAIGEVEIQIDWLRQVFIQKFNVCAIRWRLTWRDLDASPKDSAGVVIAFLRPIKLAALRVHRNADTPFPLIWSRARIALAGVHEGFDFRPVKVYPHHSHAFAIAPVELSVLLVQLELLRCESGARRNDGDYFLAIKI